MRKVTIALTGGLGNQLFQLAAALSIAEGGTVEIMSKPGRPRLNKNGDPELYSFVLPKNVVSIRNGYFQFFLSKVIGFNLRSGFSPTKLENKFNSFIQIISSYMIFLLTGKIRKLVVGQDLGYTESLVQGTKVFLIGYFQSYKYISSIGAEKFVDGLRDPGLKLNEYRELAKIEQPLVVHVRLGDYRHEDSFGILDSEYYQVNSRRIWEFGNYKKIWLFSDEPNEAMNVVPKELLEHLRVIDSTGLSSAETLKIMTFGKGYIIANSTFSWWGAFLSETKGAIVVAPNPWFNTAKSPRDLIPNSWQSASRSNLVQ